MVPHGFSATYQRLLSGAAIKSVRTQSVLGAKQVLAQKVLFASKGPLRIVDACALAIASRVDKTLDDHSPIRDHANNHINGVLCNSTQ